MARIPVSPQLMVKSDGGKDAINRLITMERDIETFIAKVRMKTKMKNEVISSGKSIAV